ncbi:MAG TPA: CapA family protein, partial [Actinomycetes bacterium]|nr:CapA family protein [Actinomycetes bacterium]
MAARRSSRLPLIWSAGALAAVLLVAGCTSGRSQGGGQAATPTTGAAMPAPPDLQIELVTTAKVPPGGL